MAKTPPKSPEAVSADPSGFLLAAASKGKILFAKDLKTGLGLSGKELVSEVTRLLSGGVLKSLGAGHTIDSDGVVTPGPVRYVANPPLQGGELWVRRSKGQGATAIVEGIGEITAFGRLVKVTGDQRKVLESRSCPVEVITDAEAIAQLARSAEETAVHKAKARDKQRSRLAELAAA